METGIIKNQMAAKEKMDHRRYDKATPQWKHNKVPPKKQPFLSFSCLIVVSCIKKYSVNDTTVCLILLVEKIVELVYPIAPLKIHH